MVEPGGSCGGGGANEIFPSHPNTGVNPSLHCKVSADSVYLIN